MATKVTRRLGWALRTRARFVAVTAVAWALVGFVVVAILQLNQAGFIRFLESALVFFGGGFAGLVWALAMWKLMFKDRVERILAAEDEAYRAEV